MQLHTGFEYVLYNIVHLRAGYLPLSTEESFSAGAGIQFARAKTTYSFDYAFKTHGTFGNTNHFTLKISYTGFKKMGGVVESVSSPVNERGDKKLRYRVILKDGTDLTGIVIFESKKKLVIEVPEFGTVVIKRPDIKSVEEQL